MEKYNMLFNAHKPLLNRDNEVMKDEDGKAITLGTIAVNALDLPAQDGEKLSAEAKLDRYMLQQKLWRAKAGVTIKSEEAVLIKKCVAQHPNFPPLFLGRINEEIEKDSK